MSFKGDTDKWVRKVNKQINSILPAFIDELAPPLVGETPVVSGRMRGSWEIALSPITPLNTTRKDPEGNLTVARLKAEIKRIKPGSVFYIHNGAVSTIEDDGPTGVVYSGIVNNTPNWRYGTLLPNQPSYMFFDRTVGNGMLVSHFNSAMKAVIV